MRHFLAPVFSSLLAVLLVTSPAAAQTETPTLERAASSLRTDPVYVDDRAERAVDRSAADRLRRSIREGDQPIFLAVLPGSAIAEAGGDVDDVPQALARRVNLAGTYGVVAGNSFRAGSTSLPAGSATAAATAAFQAHSADGTDAVLADFVDRIGRIGASSGQTRDPQIGDRSADEPADGGGGNGASSMLPLLLLLGAGGAGLYLWQRGKRRREDAEAEVEVTKDRSILRAELAVLAEDVLALEPQIALHPEARADYDAAAARYRVAQAALEEADDRIDLIRVERVIAEGRYAMDRARAIIDGRPPPPPPPDLTRRGRHDEPPVDVDDEGRPQYVGYGSPFYGGGWFGGGGGLLTGLFLGQMLGGWGGGHHEHNVYVEDSGDGGGGAEWGGGDWGGGGDFGGGDVGGGDW